MRVFLLPGETSCRRCDGAVSRNPSSKIEARTLFSSTMAILMMSFGILGRPPLHSVQLTPPPRDHATTATCLPGTSWTSGRLLLPRHCLCNARASFMNGGFQPFLASRFRMSLGDPATNWVPLMSLFAAANRRLPNRIAAFRCAPDSCAKLQEDRN